MNMNLKIQKLYTKASEEQLLWDRHDASGFQNSFSLTLQGTCPMKNESSFPNG